MFMQGRGKKPLFYLHIINQSSSERVHCIAIKQLHTFSDQSV